MFSLKIINSAKFLKMPIDAQNLYFHLGLRADDDGIVEAFSVMRLIGSPEDNLKILHAKSFVCILNEDLVTYITDWKEHNLLRADRKIDSIYKDLLVQILPEVQLLESRERSDRVRSDGLMSIEDKRKSNPELPYSFTYKIKSAFVGENCPMCGDTMDARGKKQATIQHRLPLSLGGKHALDNIAVICFDCNMKTKKIDTGKLNNEEVKNVWAVIGPSKDSVSKDKLSKDKLSKDKLSKSNTNSLFESLWKLYPKKEGKGQISQTQKEKLVKIGLEEITRCIERYKKAKAGKDRQYLQYGSTFFNSGYIDYLDENYQEEQGGQTLGNGRNNGTAQTPGSAVQTKYPINNMYADCED